MNEKQLSDERLGELIERLRPLEAYEASAVEGLYVCDQDGNTEDAADCDVLLALRELLARRAADPTPEQRNWYDVPRRF